MLLLALKKENHSVTEEILKLRIEKFDNRLGMLLEEYEDYEDSQKVTEETPSEELVNQIKRYGYALIKEFGDNEATAVVSGFEEPGVCRIVLQNRELIKRCSVVVNDYGCVYYHEVTKGFGSKRIDGKFSPAEICYFVKLYFNHNE